ncbi:MAG: AAA family ATPase, partial [Candidatus Thorarchaeota archaeon]
MTGLPDVSEYLKDNRRKRARLKLMDILEVPSMSWYDNYIPRTMPGGAKDIDVFIRACQIQRWTLLFGPTGAGKTLVGLAVAAKLKRRYTSINFHGGITADAFIGRWIPDSGADMPTVKELRERFDGDSSLVNAYIHKYRINYRWVDG